VPLHGLDAVFPLDWRLGALVAAVLLSGFTKGVTGMGLPIVGVPIMAAVYGDLRAVLLVTIFASALADLPFIVRGIRLWRQVSFLAGYLVVGLVGIVIGTRILVLVHPQYLTLTLGVLLSIFIFVSWTGRLPKIGHARAARLSPVIGLFAGILQGATGSSGPLTLTYLVSMDLSRALFLFSSNAIFTVLDWTQLVSLTRLGLYTPYLLALSGGIIVLTGAGMVVGFGAARRIDDQAFRRGVLVLLSAAALSLFVRSLRG
jgi:uncharacterized membrane protein YfcA